MGRTKHRHTAGGRVAFVGIDNGATGSIALIWPARPTHNTYQPMPKHLVQDYTKKKQNVSRLRHKDLEYLLRSWATEARLHVMLERPMINPGRWRTSMSAIRFLEATLIVLERLSLPCVFVDSKEWQKVLLPRGCKKEQLKEASRQIGTRMFPEFADVIRKQKDADGLLIAEYCRRMYR